MKNILKLSAIFFCIVLGFASCKVFDAEENHTDTAVAMTAGSTKAILSLSVADKSSRSALPSVSSAEEFESLALNGTSAASTITRSWASDGTSSAYAKMTSDKIGIDTGSWNFTLTAKKGGLTYSGTTVKEITGGENNIEFNLSVASLSNEGQGSVRISMTVPNSVKAVTANLYDTKDTPVSMAGITESCVFSESGVTYSAENVPSGTYIVIFSLYADPEKTLLLGKWREYAGITKNVTSVSSQIEIQQEGLDSVYTISYELNGGSLSGTWSGMYKRQDIAVPQESDISKEGWIFSGWYIDEDFTEAFDMSKTGRNLTLYAKWRGYSADEAIAYVQSDSFTGGNIIIEGAVTSEQIKSILGTTEEKECYLSLNLSKTTGLSTVQNIFKNAEVLTEIVSVPNTFRTL